MGLIYFWSLCVTVIYTVSAHHILLLLLLLSCFSCVRLFMTPWTAAHQAPLSMGFSRQECWSGVPLPSLPPHPRYYYFSVLSSLPSANINTYTPEGFL